MKMKTVLVLAFAVGCGLVAMMGVQQVISQNSAQNQHQSISVLVATIDIAPGVLLSSQNSEFRELPSKGIPADAVKEKSQFADRGMRVPVMAGDIIRVSKLGTRGEIAASASIPAGMRTVSIQVNDTKTHSGLLQPGDRVDLQVTYECRTPEGARRTKSGILMEYIEVFASDAFRNLEAGESKEIKAKNITLLVTPEQANFIQLANAKGELIPIMRSKTDDKLVYPNGLDASVVRELQTGVVDEIAVVREESNDNTPPVVQLPPEPAKAELIVKAEPEPVLEVEKPKPWVITVYAGEKVVQQEFALNSAGEVELEPVTRTVNENGKEPAKQSQNGMLMQDAVPEAMKSSLKAFLDSFVPGEPLTPRKPPEAELEEKEPDTRNPVEQI